MSPSFFGQPSLGIKEAPHGALKKLFIGLFQELQ